MNALNGRGTVRNMKSRPPFLKPKSKGTKPPATPKPKKGKK